MYTVKSIMAKIVNPNELMPNIEEAMRTLDPSFDNEYRRYTQAVIEFKSVLEENISPSLDDYIAAKNAEFCAETLFITWLGFQQNLDCYRNPVNSCFIDLEYETLHREHRFPTLPHVKKALCTIELFYEALRVYPKKITDLETGITDYFSYLETTVFKLAHYFGFLFADQFLGHVVPGYCPDPIITSQYRSQLEEYLQIDISGIEK